MLYGFAITTDNGTEYGLVSAEDEDTALGICRTSFDDFREIEMIDAEEVVCIQYSGIMLGTSQ